MEPKDPKGYYAILEVTPGASSSEIKAAYRRRAMELHPDRNPSTNATCEFQRLNEAHEILGDPSSRARYDASSADPNGAHPAPSPQRPAPIECSICAKVTAQPRYVVFYEVKSFIFLTTRTPIQGVFCSGCAEKKALRATAVTWLLGWWGFPWGFIYSLHAILSNLVGGERPVTINAKLAVQQTWVFAALGKVELALAMAEDARALVRRVKPEKDARRKRDLGYDSVDERAQLTKVLETTIDAMGRGTSQLRLNNSWALFRRPFFIQSAVIVAVSLLLGIAIAREDGPSVHDQTAERSATDYSAAAHIAPASYRPQSPYNGIRSPLPYRRPATSPNGTPWPTAADYIRNSPRLRSSGLSTVTVDNTRSESDVFVKLYFLNSSRPYPARLIFVPAHAAFTLGKVSPGNYDVRYRDLDTGGLSRSEPFSLEATRTGNGTEYSTITMTLYKVRDGNMQSYPITDDDF